MRRFTGLVVGIVLVLCWSQVADAQKVLTVLGTMTSSADTQGRDFIYPNIVFSADTIARDGSPVAARFLKNGFGEGSVSMDLIDRGGGQVVVELLAKLDTGGRPPIIYLSTETGLAGLSPSNNPFLPERVHWIVDEASFAKGLVRMKISGLFPGVDGGPSDIQARTRNALDRDEFAYAEQREMAGLWVIEFPFTVKEY